MTHRNAYDELNRRIVTCDACPRLVAHCRKIAADKRAAYRDDTYHGRPVPNFGDHDARLLIAGLAPAAHGANRTGRMFTGDRSGDFLFDVMHAAGFANQRTGDRADDGLQLLDACITAACHCAPPANKPTARELRQCSGFLQQTFDVLPRIKVVMCLGRIGFDAITMHYQDQGWIDKRSAYRFGHGVHHAIDAAPDILCCYHPSQQNTFTGRLTREMMLDVFRQARKRIDAAG